MQNLTLRYRHGELPSDVAAVLKKKADSIGRKHEDIQDLDVVIDVPHKSQRKGNETVVRITATIPRKNPIIVHGNDAEVVEQGQNVFYAIDQAFEAMEHKLVRLKSKSRRPRASLAESIVSAF